MNRQIEFRGKRIDNDEWVYGYYVENKLGNHFIYEIERNGEFVWNSYEVDPLTVGQFTGLVDKNDVKIYEFDAILIPQEDDELEFIVKWEEDLAQYILFCESDNYYVDFDNYWSYNTEVVGNIFDKENKDV